MVDSPEVAAADGEPGVPAPVWARRLDDVPWIAYEDPHLPGGENAAQVKIVDEKVFLAYFPPGYSAPAHSHPGDTTYYVLEGAIRFGDEGWVGPNSIRAVKAGHAYGPEEADPEQGVKFLLISNEPIAIDWVEP